MVKTLRILKADEEKRFVRAFTASTKGKYLLIVHSSKSIAFDNLYYRKTFYYVDGKFIKRVDSSEFRWCEWCNDVRTDVQTTYCRAISGGMSRFCALCGCEVWPLWMVDLAGRSLLNFSAYATFWNVQYSKRERSLRINFYNGAFINVPKPKKQCLERA